MEDKSEIQNLLFANKLWSRNKLEVDPKFFQKLLDVQSPKYLWIGCSDSRVPPDQITQTQPGEIFIHRNIANMVVHTDLNLMSVLQYAVEVLKVKHVIVCGHYGCGGVKAALSRSSFGIIDKWLRNIKDVYRFNEPYILQEQDEKKKLNKLIEYNILEQVKNLSKTTVIQKSWKKENSPTLHGWVYDLQDGIIKPLIEVKPHDWIIESIYQYDI